MIRNAYRNRASGAQSRLFSVDWFALSFAVAATTASGAYEMLHADQGGLMGLISALAG